MNHDRFEALRNKGIAEKMINSEDYMGARDKLLQAKKLYPLDNITSMLTVCDILCAASIRFPGNGMDFYWVLQLLPSANDSDIKPRYQKLVALLQPIKNKFPGTNLALKFIHDALSVLSDKEKRSAFDSKRGESWKNCGNLYSKDLNDPELTDKDRVANAQSYSVDKMTSRSEISDGSNGENVPKEMISTGMKHLGANLLANHNSDKQREEVVPQEASWASASMISEGKGEVDRAADGKSSPTTTHSISLNKNLSRSSKSVAQKRLKPNFYNFENNRKNEVFEVGQIWAAHHEAKFPCRYAQINSKSKFDLNVTWLKPVPLTADERRWCDADLPVACGYFALDSEMGEEKLSGTMVFSQICSWSHGATEKQFEIYPKKGEVWAIYKDWDLFEWSYDPETMRGCKFEIVEILTDHFKYLGALVRRLVKVEGFKNIFQRDTDDENKSTFKISPNNLYMFSHNIAVYRRMGGEIDKVEDGMLELDPLALPNNDANLNFPKEGSSSSFSTHPFKDLPPARLYPENSNLKLSWSKSDFSVGQIWAIYSGIDAMPRRYTLINSVLSESQVRVTFLEPHSIMDYEIQWEKENLPIVCGVFRVGKTVLNLEMSWFSYLVKCQRSVNKLFYKIYPRKGEIWAMYKNWNVKWKQSDYRSYQCRVVEILSDFSEENGVSVGRMVEVKGCMTFFQRHQFDGFGLTCGVLKADMLCFSHRIPEFRVPGIGCYGIPENSWHLEPDVLPPRLRG